MNAAPPGTFVVRPQTSFVLASNLAIGAITLLAVGFGLLNRSLSSTLVFLAIGGLFLFAFDYGSLSADGERVWCTHLFGRGKCRRDELAGMSIRAVYRRGRRTIHCSFDRNDGTVAFAVPIMVFGSEPLEQLAAFLRVPIRNLVL